MKTNTKNLKYIITATILTLVVLMTGFILASCGQNLYSTYKFETDAPNEIYVGEQVNFNVTLKTDELGEKGYESVQIWLELDNDQNLDIVATDEQGREFNLSELKTWGPSTGFELPAEYSATTPIKFTAKQSGEFSITLKVVDLKNDNSIIVETTSNFTVNDSRYSDLAEIISHSGNNITEDNLVNNVSVIFYNEPSKISAFYNGEKVGLEKSVLEDYEGPESGVTAYQYLFELDTPVSIEEFNSNPVKITCEINDKVYSFNLTTNLIDKILEAFM